MQSIEQSGRTVEDAVNAALKMLGVSRDEVEVEVLAEESRGLLGILGHTEAKVRVTRKAGLAERAAEITREILRLMEVEATVTIDADSPEGVEISVDAETDLGLLIGKRGQCLAALQLIVAMMANRQLDPESRRRVILDVGGYRERRERALKTMAHNAAGRAKRSGQSVSLEPLNARERRIVHLALAEESGVTTRSEGTDPRRYIVVVPKRARRQ